MSNQQIRQDEGDIREIDLRRVAQAVWKRAWIILLVAFITATAAYIYSSMFVTPMYRTGFKAIIYNREAEDGNKGSTSTSDLTASVGLTYIYNEILTSRRVLVEAAEKCGLKMSYGALSRTVSTNISEGAPVVQVYVSMTDPTRAKELATAISQVAPEYVNTLPLSSAMFVIDEPAMPAGKYAPNNATNALMGFAVGLLVSCGVVIAVDLIRDKVESGQDLERRYHVAILGSIPDILQAEKVGNNNYYYKNRKG